MRFIICSVSSISLSACLFLTVACGQTHSHASAPPQVSTFLLAGQEYGAFGSLRYSQNQAVEGSGSLRALDLLSPSHESFRLHFDLKDAESSVALHLYTKAGFADGLNLEFYPKQNQLFVLANTSDKEGVITSINEPLGKYSPTESLALSVEVTLDPLKAPQLKIQRSATDSEVQEFPLSFPENSKPLESKERNWSLYLSKASVTTLFHEALQ